MRAGLHRSIHRNSHLTSDALHHQDLRAEALSVPVCLLCLASLLITRWMGAVQADELELEALEAQLSVYDILLFRTMAERKAQGPKVSLDVAREPRPKDGSQEGTEAM